MSPSGELLRRREAKPYLKVSDEELDAFAKKFPELVLQIKERGRRYYRRWVIEEKILGRTNANSV